MPNINYGHNRELIKLEGKIEGKIETYLELIKEGVFTISDVAERLQISTEEVEKLLDSLE